MKTTAYLRISTDQQDLDSQKLAIHEYARKHKIKIHDFMIIQSSSRKSTKERKVDKLLAKSKPGDTIIVSELSRLGRSLAQIINIVDMLIKEQIKLITIKENIILNGKQDIQSKVTVALFGLFAEIERDLISERTKHGLATAREKGKLLGRPKGSLGNSRLNGREEEIKLYLSKKVSKSAIARITGVSRT